MTQATFQQWFCLREGRENFGVDPARDSRFLFGEEKWEKEINLRLKRAQLLGVPIRLVWWGQFGIGKTHRLRHTQFLVEENHYNFFPCYVVASDIQERTGFDRLHRELVNGLGRERIQAYVKSYLLKVQNKVPDIVPLPDICRGSNDVQAAIESLAIDRMMITAWSFLSGLPLDRSEKNQIGVAKVQLDSSNEFSAVIHAFGHIIRTETGGKQLLYLIDEMENLLKVTNKTAEARWQEALRAILDLKNVGVVTTIGAERQLDLPKVILSPDIVRRIERDNYVLMEAYNHPVANSFLNGLLKNLIDSDRLVELEKSEKLTDDPGYSRDVYPFSVSAFERFCEYAVVDPRTAKPSEIIARLNMIAAEAYLKELRLITADHLTDLGIA